MKKSIAVAILITLFSGYAVYAQAYKPVSVSKILAFPENYYNTKVQLSRMEVHGEVKALNEFYAVYVSTERYDIFLADYNNKITFLITKQVAMDLTDMLDSGKYYICDIFGTIIKYDNRGGFPSIVTCFYIDTINILNRNNTIYKVLK